jgi:hypothetical protein
LPGTVVASQTGLAYTDSTGFGAPSITLSSPVALGEGTYWVSIQSRMDFGVGGQWGWEDRATQSNSGAAWQNPGDGLATGCTTWAPKINCIATTAPDMMFRLSGTAGGGGGGGCSDPSDVPWLSESPSSGSVDGGESQDSTVTVDASSLAAGSYSAHICVATNDPTHELVDVPVSATVTGGGGDPVASITPASLAVTVETGASTTTPLHIANTGGGTLTFDIGEAPAGIGQPYRPMSDAQPNAMASFVRAQSGASERGQDVVLHGLDPNGNLDISQMTDNTPQSLNGVACGTSGVSTADNSWWRRFYFSEHPGVGASTTINSVTVATESGPSTPVTVNVYSIPHSVAMDTIPTGQLTLIGSGTGTVGGDLTTSLVTISGGATIADTATTDLVVEYHIDGAATPFFPGGNPTTQTHPTFLSSETCALTDPTDAAQLGFPDFHIIMVVNVGGEAPPTGCDNPSDVPWLSESPQSGSVTGGSTTDSTVTVDAASLAPGNYSAHLCVATNDPAHALVDVPVSATVTSGGGGGDLLVVDLSTPNQVTVSATGGTSQATVSGSTTTGWLFDTLFSNAGTQAIGTTTIVGTATLTAASVPPDGSPALFRSGDTDAGLNIWSYSASATTTFTAGQVAFTGSATWSISPALYAAMLTAPASGNVYFPADDTGDLSAGAQLLGTYSVIGGGGGGDPVAEVTPSSFAFTVEAGGTDSGTMNVANTGGGTLTYSIAEAEVTGVIGGPYRPHHVRRASKFDPAPTGELQQSTTGEAGARGKEVSLRGLGPNGNVDISQMTDNTPQSLNGVACGTSGVSTADNSWWRRFYFSEHPEVGASTTINSVTVATESGPSTPVTVNVYSIPHSAAVDTIPTGQLTLIGTGTGTVGGDLTTSQVTISGGATIADTATTDLVVEYHIDGAATPFFPGGNPTTQTHPTFLSSETCALTDPTDAAQLGFPDFHIIMVVNVGGGGGGGGGCSTPVDVPWLSATPTSGSVTGGDSAAVTVAVDAGALTEGDYQALLCVTTNDPAHALVEVPVGLTVTQAPPDDGIFCSGFETGEDGSCGSGGGGGPFEQPLQDPSFETTQFDAGPNDFWTGTDSNDTSGGTPFWSDAARTGAFGAWGGGWREPGTQEWSQQVTIASGGPRYLNYWYSVTAQPVNATLTIKIDGTTVSTVDVTSLGLIDWTNGTVDISTYGDDAAHTVDFVYTAEDGDDGNLFVDDITIDESAGSSRPARH